MTIKAILSDLWKKACAIDRTLLIFLILFLNVKLLVKVLAIVVIFFFRSHFKFGFKLKNSRLPLFYLIVICIAVFNYAISGQVGKLNYSLVFITGIFFWLLCIMAAHQIRAAVEKNDLQVIHNTIFIFLLINALISLSMYTAIIIETGHINPYRYQGNFQKYFIGTGDYIKGITLDTSTTNAVLNAFAVIYFLARYKYLMALLCMTVLLFTGSNVTNLLLCGTLLFMFIFKSSKSQKSIIVICFAMLMIFMIKISPQNTDYITGAWGKLFNFKAKSIAVASAVKITDRPDSLLNEEERKEKTARVYLDSLFKVKMEQENKNIAATVLSGHDIKLREKPIIPRDSIHTPKFQHKKDTTVVEKELISFVRQNPAEMPLTAEKKLNSKLPGKLRAVLQTFAYLKKHPRYWVTGTGIGNFSSKLAFRATALKIAGGYPAGFAYVNDDFRSNHLDLYSYYFTNKDDLHSIANSPNSTYDQLLSEYGVAGVLAFAFFYIGFFLKGVKQLTYAIPLLLFMTGVFFIEYWFEQLSVVVFFELLVLLNIKETAIKK